MDRIKKIPRWVIQAIATFITNMNLIGFIKGEIYTGKFKNLCVPGLNCYSCPGAVGSCPIGSLQAVLSSSGKKISFYITGFIALIGVMLGRFVCGWLCPFGWFQELLHKIPSKKLSTKKLYVLTYLKYIILILFVLILPVVIVNEVGMGTPYFCKYICPAGIIEGGIPLSVTNYGIRQALGPLFIWKFCLLVITIVLSVLFYRPFCKWMCPLGAIYAVFNKVSLYHINLDKDKCISCEKCVRVCKMDVDVLKNQNHRECIRCKECINVCPTQALSSEFSLKDDTRKKIKHSCGK